MAVCPPSTDHTALGLTFLIAAGTLLSPIWAAPASSKASDPWWFKPCERDIHPNRHSRSATHNKVLLHLNDSLHRLKKNFENIDKLYEKKITGTKIAFVKIKGLKTRTYLRKMNSNSNTTLTELYKALHHFAGTADQLWHMKIGTKSHFNHHKREELYEKICYLIRNFLCTVQETIINNDVPGGVPAGIPLKKMKISLKNQTDLTDAQNLDVNFSSKTLKFFARAKKILVKQNKKKIKNNRRKSAVNNKNKRT